MKPQWRNIHPYPTLTRTGKAAFRRGWRDAKKGNVFPWVVIYLKKDGTHYDNPRIEPWIAGGLAYYRSISKQSVNNQ